MNLEIEKQMDRLLVLFLFAIRIGNFHEGGRTETLFPGLDSVAH